MSAATPIETLLTALAEAAEQLEAGDAVEAARAVERAVGACEKAQQDALVLDENSVKRACELQQRAVRAGARLQQTLVKTVVEVGVSRRALGVYGHGE